MRKLIFILIFAVFSVSINGNGVESLIIEDANVVDIKSGKVRLLSIKIINGKISKISSKRIEGPNRIDLKGKYIMPHLWDMHVHLHGNEGDLEKLANSGILGLRDVGAFGQEEFDFLKRWTNPRSSKKIMPKIYYAGFTHNGKECEVEQHKSVDTPEELRMAITFQKDNRIKFFKLHNCFPSSLLKNLIGISKKENIKIIGHIPQGIDPIDYAKMNISSIEHMDILMRALSFRKDNPAKSITEAINILEGEYLDDLARVLIENEVAITPTLVAYENFVNGLPENQKPLGNTVLKRLQNFTKRLSDKGVLLLAGSDMGLPGIEPGKSLKRELDLMVESGLTPQEALQTATINPIKYLGLSDSAISRNSIADFIVVDGNPLEEIENLHNIYAVVRNGNYKIISKLVS